MKGLLQISSLHSPPTIIQNEIQSAGLMKLLSQLVDVTSTTPPDIHSLALNKVVFYDTAQPDYASGASVEATETTVLFTSSPDGVWVNAVLDYGIEFSNVSTASLSFGDTIFSLASIIPSKDKQVTDKWIIQWKIIS